MRVRPTHKRNNGRKFSWSDPPDDTGHPGDDYGCRCHADPDLSGITGGDIAAPKEGPLTDTPEGKPELVEKYKPKPKPPTASPSPRQDPASGRMRGVKYFNPDWDEEKKARWFLWQWVNGSKSKGSVLGKKAAIEEFGLAGKPFSKTDWNHSPKNLEALRPGLRKVYEQTQEDLFSEPHLEELRKMGKLTHVKTIGGKKHIKLYRGVKEKYDEAERGSLESWTINRGTADAFAGKNGDVEVQWVDAERILAHHKGPQWKNGKYGEQYEYVVMW